MDNIRFFIFDTVHPTGERFVSIVKVNGHALMERRVFRVSEELDSTPHAHGMTTKKLFLNT